MNPFRSGIVTSPWEAGDVDVSDIHREVYERCLLGIEQVRQTRHSASLMIHGVAGSGKTHLLQRLRAHLTPKAPSDTRRDEYLYVWVRLQTSPRMIWRTLRRTLVNDWFRPVGDMKSQFQRILFHRFAEIRTAEGDLDRWYDYMLEKDPDGLRDLLERIARSLDLDRNTAVAFEHIAFNRHVRDLRAWLSGDSLPEAALVRMDLAQDEGTDEEREDESRRIVLMLCRLAGDGLPIVISFDQVEALQMSSRDRDALFSFGQLTSTLHDNTTNVLVVSCVQSSFYDDLHNHSREADYDRMTSLGAFSLHPLERTEALQLIQARLALARQLGADGFPDTGCWPLTDEDLQQLFGMNKPVSPRKLLALCAERFEDWASGKSSAPSVETSGAPAAPAPVAPAVTKPVVSKEEIAKTFLRDKFASTVEEKHAINSAERTEEIVRHGLPMLAGMVKPDIEISTDEQLADVSLILSADSQRTGVSVCTQSNMNSLGGRFRRLKTQFASGKLDRLVVIRDTRVPITEGSKKTKQYLEELEQQKAVILHPAVEALAALDALRDLLSDARSGNLSCRGDTIAPKSVEDWLIMNLPDGLRDLVENVLGTKSADDAMSTDPRHVEALNTLLATRPMLPLEDASKTLGQGVEALTALVERHPAQFRLLAGPPAIVFRSGQSAS